MQYFGPKIRLLYGTAILVNGPFVALVVAVVLARLEAFFDFSFPSYGRFRGPAILRPFWGSQGPPRPKKLIQTANKGARFTPVCPQSLLKPFKLVQLLKKIRALIPAHYPIVHTVPVICRVSTVDSECLSTPQLSP